MVFSSTIFLFAFLPLTGLLYLFATRAARPYVLVVMSLLFYAWGEPKNLSVLLFVCLVTYAGGLLIAARSHPRFFLALSVSLNLVTLAVFKYTDFALVNLGALMGHKFFLPHIALPIGISFFIFQAISYLVDIYKGDVAPQKDIIRLILYISFFPQLVAGPIIKYHEVEHYLTAPDTSLENTVSGAQRFITGLAKKVLLANTFGEVADAAFGNAGELSIGAAWLGALAYMLQIYFDFSGYSDMAIGLGRMFGFHFRENFNLPYMSLSISEFWRRWHISLGTWFKEYLYIPLGGSRLGARRTYLNLAIVFFITGVWHGAAWTFILWGCWHGLFVIVERALGVRDLGHRFSIPRHAYVLFAVLVGWVLFRAESLSAAQVYFSSMLGQGAGIITAVYFFDVKFLLALICGTLFSTPLPSRLCARIKDVPSFAVSFVLLFLSLVYVAASTYNPFIYFRF